MFTIKRSSARKRTAKKLPYHKLDNAEPHSSSSEQRMPNIDDVNVIKSCVGYTTTTNTLDTLSTPQLPMLANPKDPNLIENISEYVYEEKFDGERMLAVVWNSARKKCFTRTLQQSNIFKHNITLKSDFTMCIFDGELVYLDKFDRLVPICDTGARRTLKVQYRVFDIQMMNGECVHHKPLLQRKKLISECLNTDEFVQISKFTECDTLDKTMAAFHSVCSAGGEGLMLKHINGHYVPNRREWIKVKSLHLKFNRDEYELYAYRFKDDKNGVRNILDCGYFDGDNNYIHVSNVSSGINNELRNRLKLMSDPVTGLFIQKVIVTIVADKITTHKSLRHPSLYRIRTDIDTIDISKFI